jgi:hypothetical protein
MSRSGSGVTRKQWFLIVLGAALGAFFLYLTFRDISWIEFKQGIDQLRPIYLIPCAILLAMIQFVRALRFGVIMRPFCRLSIKDLWDLLNIWGALNLIMPARLAEFARPYLLQRRGVPFSSVFGAVMVERFFDLSGLLLLLAICLSRTPEIPAQYSSLGKWMFGFLAFGYLIVLMILARKDLVHRIMERVLSVLPERPARFLSSLALKLIDGLAVMASVPRALIIFVYSVTIWLLFSLITHLFLKAFGIEAPFLVAVTTQVFVSMGVALPSAPGFVGTFHVAVRYSLMLFGVQAALAVSLGTVFHLFNLVACLILGAASYYFGDFRITSETIFKDEKPSSVTEDTLVAGRG